MITTIATPFTSVYGPVQSWRFGRSLGIDPIGSCSCCSFNCVYCQLGEIERQSCTRQIFVPTEQIRQDLQSFTLCDVDTITLSGSGEPTLAQNLGEILVMAQETIAKPIGVLTNGSLLHDPQVREELAIADWVAVKIDAIDPDSFRRIDRPMSTINLEEIWAGLLQFRQIYSGQLAIQTMLLTAWSDRQQTDYLHRMQALQPDEIQLNTPTRPQPLVHQLVARGNHPPTAGGSGAFALAIASPVVNRAYPTKQLKRVDSEVLQAFADRLETAMGIPVRYPSQK